MFFMYLCLHMNGVRVHLERVHLRQVGNEYLFPIRVGSGFPFPVRNEYLFVSNPSGKRIPVSSAWETSFRFLSEWETDSRFQWETSFRFRSQYEFPRQKA